MPLLKNVRSWLAGIFLLVLFSSSAYALNKEVIARLSTGGIADKIEAINQLAASGDLMALPVLQALQEGTLYLSKDGAAFINKEGVILDALTQKNVVPVPNDLTKVTINNRLRKILNSALATLKLSSPQRAIRLAAANEIQKNANDGMLPLIERALTTETDAEIENLLLLT